MYRQNREILSDVEMVIKVSLSGLSLTAIGLLIVIFYAFNMNNFHSVDKLLPELGLIFVGMAVQLLGLGLVLVGKK